MAGHLEPMRGYYSSNWNSSSREANSTMEVQTTNTMGVQTNNTMGVQTNNTMGVQTNHWSSRTGSVARQGAQVANLGRHQKEWRTNASEGRPKTILDKRWRRKKQNRKNIPKNISICPDPGNWTVPSSSFAFPLPHNHIHSEFLEAPSRFSEPPPTVVSEPEALDIGTLLSQLQKNGLIGLSQKLIKKVPEITLERSHPSLKTRHPEIISQLYGDKPLKCKTCAERFSSEEKTKYGSHLDWHFIKNQNKRDGRETNSRGWYTNSWGDDASHDVTVDMKKVHEEPEKVEEKVVTVGDGEEGSRCPKCFERFELFYSEVEDDKSRNMNSLWTDELSRDGQWFFKNAVRINKDVYHPQCYREEGSINL